ncbi:pectate lyase family protein [Cellvibrio mixtus]|uniref:pectate lyase family protein n=1 Tax=Cellvibrio mixtus TaxID=39650 RepID=UPI0006945A16|nr:pectate lyase [Cellvibrio mixtus]
MKTKLFSKRVGLFSKRASQCAALTLAISFFAGTVHAQTLGSNLAVTGPSAGADGSGFDNTKLVRDGNTATVSVASGTSNQRVSVKWGSAVSFNTVILRESGSKITNWQLVDNDSGTVYASGTGIGAEKVINVGPRSSKKINLIVNATSAPGIAEFEVYNATGTVTSSSKSSSSIVVSSSSKSSVSSSKSSVVVSSSSSSKSSVVSSAIVVSSSSVVSSKSSSSVSSISDNGNISADCIRLATNPSVNWRDTSLKTDQEIVSCLSKTLGKPVGYGEKALGGFDPNGNSKLTIITKNSSTSVEQQILTAITGEAHNWIVFDKVQFAQPHEIGMYRLGCSNPTVQSILGATAAECVNYTQWCAKNGVNSANCVTQFFNTAMNKSNNPIRNPVIGSNKTIDGRGSEAYFLFSGFAIGKDQTGTPTQTANSVILTHLNFKGAGHTEDHYCDPDMIRSTGASHDIWIHKNNFDTTGDSAFDVKVGAYNVTMSFNRLINVKRAVLHGSSDSHTIDKQITTTMHNNAFITTDDSYQLLGNTLRRVPLLRHGKTHMFNNVFMNYRNQILSLRVGASALMEDSVFVVNAVHQEKSTVEASLAEISSNLFKDISGGSFRNDRNFLWFGDSACNLTAATKTTLTATNGTVANLASNYNSASQATINNWRFAAGQDLVDYVNATAGKYGQIPYNSPLAADKYYVLGLGKSSCQNR